MLNSIHDFMRQTCFAPFRAALWKCAAYGCMPKGDGEGGKRGTGGENPEGEGGLQPGCPPSPGLSPQDSGRTLLRKRRTQSIKENTQANGHKYKPHKNQRSHKKKNRACALFLTLRQSSPAAASPDSDASRTSPHKSASDSPLCPCTSAGSARFWTPAPAPA